MKSAHQTLTQRDRDHFLEKGHVVVRGCFDRSFAREWTDLAFKRLGYKPDDPTSWSEPRVHLPSMNRVAIRTLAPKAWDALCDLAGGSERIDGEEPAWGDGLICNFNLRADEPWQAPSPQCPGWHKDGDFFRHFLDSPEQGLLTIVIWSDIKPQSGGTFVACDSVPVVARHLLTHPEGLLPGQFGSLIDQCSDFIELTGEAGDVVILHPFVLHAASNNPSGRARFITNPPIALKEPMNFNRANPADFSPVELGVLRGLGLKRLDFCVTGDRERIVPERVRRQQKMLEEQKKRMETAP